ncbi:MAG: hypothetical protein IJT91_01920 [Clostridia bacterium]|nr:hypothetical protein [Clostridia bacterium]
MKIKKTNELAYVLGLLICSLGVTFSANSGFGVSMVVAPAYVLHRKLSLTWGWFTFGVAEYVLQGALIIFLIILLRRFKLKYLLSFVTAILYGLSLDMWRSVIGTAVYPEMYQRIISGVAGCFITSFAIALMLRTYLPQQAYELVVKEITDGFGYDMHKVKWIYDVSSLAFAVLLMLILFGKFSFDMIGIGTLILTVVNTPVIKFCGMILDKISDFSPAFPKLREKIG